MLIRKVQLLKTIEWLKQNHTDFKNVAEELFQFNYADYDAAFNISRITVPASSYVRVPVYADACCAILMLWGAHDCSAIHDHLNYDGLIKVLKGNLTEISYGEEGNFIKKIGEGIASEGTVFAEALGGIHSVVNNLSRLSVSLHVYRTPQTTLNGVRIFDVEHRRTGYLNEKAPSCSWALPADNFQKIVEVA